MVNLTATEDEWQSEDETGYENPYDFDPNTDDENDPTMDGDDPDLDENEVDDEEYDEEYDEEVDEEPAQPAKVEPVYPNVAEWVEGFFTQVIRRRMGTGGGEGGLAWDERWWLYPEVAGRLKSLWYAWEEARVSDKGSAMSGWWVHHLEPQLRVILDGDTGPMAHAKDDGSFSGWPALPHQQVPAEVLAGLIAD